MEKAVDRELTKLMLEGLEPEKTVEEQAIEDASFDAEIKAINDMPVGYVCEFDFDEITEIRKED